jgi:hypothetical protein
MGLLIEITCDLEYLPWDLLHRPVALSNAYPPGWVQPHLEAHQRGFGLFSFKSEPEKLNPAL